MTIETYLKRSNLEYHQLSSKRLVIAVDYEPKASIKEIRSSWSPRKDEPDLRWDKIVYTQPGKILDLSVVEDVYTSLLGVKAQRRVVIGGYRYMLGTYRYRVKDHVAHAPLWALVLHELTLDQEFLRQFPTTLIDPEELTWDFEL